MFKDIRTAVDSYMADLNLRGIAQNTIMLYEPILEQLVDYCQTNKITLTNYQELDIGNFLNLFPNVKKSSLVIYQVIVKAFTTYLVNNKAIKDIPVFKKIVANKSTPNFHSMKTVRDIYKNLTIPLEKAIFRSLVVSGLRVSELANLKKVDVNWANGALIIRNTKGNADRTIFVDPETLALLDEQAQKNTTEYVLLSTNGKRLDRAIVYGLMAKIGKRFNCHLNPHSLRHTALTELLKSSRQLPLVQLQAGHKDIATTMKYVHMTGEDLQAGTAQYIKTFDEGGGEDDGSTISTK